MVLINGATPQIKQEVQEILEAYKDRLPLQVEISEQNLGFAGGHQQLFAQHEADVLLVNDDVELEPEYIQILREFLQEYQEVGAVSGALFRADGSIDTLGMVRKVSGKVIDRDQGTQAPVPTEPFAVFGVSGALPLIRREAALAASHDGALLDATFETYKEDVDLAYRFQMLGIPAVIVPAAKAIHHRTFRASRLHKGVSEYAQKYSYRNHWWILLTYYRWQHVLREGWALIPFEIAKFGFMLLTNPKILLWTWRSTRAHWPYLMHKRRYFYEEADTHTGCDCHGLDE